MDAMTQFVDALTGQASMGGWYAAVGSLGTLVLFAVRIFRMDIVQSLLPEKYKWERWTPMGKFLIPFATAAIGAFLVGLAAKLAAGLAFGTVIGPLLGSAVAAGLAAVALHKGTQNAGTNISMSKLTTDPNYTPTPLRKAMSLLVPIETERARRKIKSREDNQ